VHCSSGKNTDNDSCCEENSSEDNVSDTEQLQRADDGSSQDSDEDIAGTPLVFHQASLDDELDLISTHLYESKNGKEVWLKTPYVSTGRQPSRNVMKQVPGPTGYARRNADTMISTLELHITASEVIVPFDST